MSANLVLDLQKRHAEVFRIRLGARNQRGYPTKLTEAIRVTSRGESIVEAFTRVYGGETKPWKNGDEQQYEAFLPTTALHVMLLPGQSIYQRWERYAKSVCERRCNGAHDEIGDRPCVCPADIDERLADKNACNIMTRINVVCPDVEVVGAGSLVSHGRIAAETLPQSVAIAEAALARGVMVPAVLRTIEHRGRNHYVVPQLEVVGVSLNQLEAGEMGGPQVGGGVPVAVGGGQRAIGAPAQPALPPLPGEVDEEPADAEIVEGGDGTFDNREASEGALGRAAASPSPDVRSEPTEANRTSAPSENVDLGDLEALLDDAKKRGATVPGKVPVRRKYNEHIFADEHAEAEAGKWADMVPGAALDAAYAWVEAQVSSPSPGEDGRTADDASPPSSGSGQPPAQKALHAAIASFVGGDRAKQDKARHALVAWATNGERDSSSALDGGELSQAIEAVPRLHLRSNGEWEVR